MRLGDEEGLAKENMKVMVNSMGHQWGGRGHWKCQVWTTLLRRLQQHMLVH